VKTLKEFLAEHAEIERGRADEKRAMQQEWIGSLHRLIGQIREWLQDSDPEHLLKVEESYHEIREVDVGVYTAPGLAIRLEAREVRLIPIARKVAGPHLSNGLIHVRRAFGRTDLIGGGKKYLLFRSQADPTDDWVIVEDDGFRVKKLDRPAFEEALQSLLQ
jgi:hypothetical protein